MYDGSDMQRELEFECRRAAAAIVFKAIAILTTLAAIVYALAGCDAQTTVAEHAAGQPLDAMAYEAPAFTGNGMPCYKVVDRITGESWWVVCMGGAGQLGGCSWVVMPAGD